MVRWRIIAVPLLLVLPFVVAGLLGVRRTPSTLPTCLEVVETVDFEQAPVDGMWLRQIEISNCGGATIELGAVSIDPPGHADGFSLLGPVASHIDVDTPLKLTVGFAPARLGHHSGALRVSVGGHIPVEVDLFGEGTRRATHRPASADQRCAAALPGGFVARGLCTDDALRMHPSIDRARQQLVPAANPPFIPNVSLSPDATVPSI